jgi:hypothetical protein
VFKFTELDSSNSDSREELSELSKQPLNACALVLSDLLLVISVDSASISAEI